MELSNKTLALLLVVALVVSMSGTLLSLSKLESIHPSSTPGVSGAASDNGNVTLTINNTASLIFIVNSINFGSGYINVTAGAANCTMESTGAIAQYNCIGFNNVTQPLELLNNGNKNLSVSLNASVNASALFGGALGGGPLFWWNISNNGTSTTCAAQDQNLTWWSNWTNVTSAPPFPICGGMLWTAPNNAIQIHFRVRFVSDSFGGQRNATITAVGQPQ